MSIASKRPSLRNPRRRAFFRREQIQRKAIDAAIAALANPETEGQDKIDAAGAILVDAQQSARLVQIPASMRPEPLEENVLLGLLADIRVAAGDSEGKLMQDELVERIHALRIKAVENGGY